MRFEIPYLEILITQKCTLNCDGCCVYSNYNLYKETSFSENAELIRLWGNRLSPKTFRILGGEPFLHENLLEYVKLAYDIWPDSSRWVVTNGTRIDKFQEFPKLAADTNTKIHLSFHSDDLKYLDKIKNGIALMKKWVKEYPSLIIYPQDNREFVRNHMGLGENMRPYKDGNPVGSWNQCRSKMCKNIGSGRLWKCPQIMLLKNVLAKFNLADHPDWKPYLRYDGLGVDVSDEELMAFLGRESEFICSMCPSQHSAISYRKDVFNVDFKIDQERVEYIGDAVDMVQFIGSIEMRNF